LSEKIKTTVIEVGHLRDIIIASEEIILRYKNYYYTMVFSPDMVIYFVYILPPNTELPTGEYVTLHDNNELLFSATPKVGYKKIITVTSDSLAWMSFIEYYEHKSS